MASAQQIDSLHDSEFPPGADPALAPAAVRRVLDAMTRAALPFTLKHLPPEATTTEEIAEACDCDVNFIVVPVLFRSKNTKKPFLLFHSGASQVNERFISQIVGENLHRADADFALRCAGYVNEAIPPMPHLNRIPVMLDTQLLRFARVWVPAGAPGYVASVPTMVMARAIAARIIRLDP
ncbi:MAG: hypothetical protein LCH38_01005 [Proteobacteria bacterium]|nr:hypothetical protein [Pseudomonadota bacterium]